MYIEFIDLRREGSKIYADILFDAAGTDKKLGFREELFEHIDTELFLEFWEESGRAISFKIKEEFLQHFSPQIQAIIRERRVPSIRIKYLERRANQILATINIFDEDHITQDNVDTKIILEAVWKSKQRLPFAATTRYLAKKAKIIATYNEETRRFIERVAV